MIRGRRVGIDKINKKEGRNMEGLKMRCPSCSYDFRLQVKEKVEDDAAFFCPACKHCGPLAEFTPKTSKLAAGIGIAFMLLIFVGIIGAVTSGQAGVAVIFTAIFIMLIVLLFKH